MTSSFSGSRTGSGLIVIYFARAFVDLWAASPMMDVAKIVSSKWRNFSLTCKFVKWKSRISLTMWYEGVLSALILEYYQYLSVAIGPTHTCFSSILHTLCSMDTWIIYVECCVLLQTLFLKIFLNNVHERDERFSTHLLEMHSEKGDDILDTFFKRNI